MVKNYLLWLICALLPSFIWLLVFLRKDSHPESNKMVLKVFFWGMLATLPAVFTELGASMELKKLINFPHLLILLINFFLVVAFTEELMKYLVVRKKALKHHELDEPVDIMFYMIIAGLGFAALENLLYLSFPEQFLPLEMISKYGENAVLILLGSIRFLSSTFLHALTSAIFGYFLALGFLETKRRTLYTFFGFFLAIALHGLYNLSIIMVENLFLKVLVIFAILIGMAIFVFWGFKRLKKLSSVCKIC